MVRGSNGSASVCVKTESGTMIEGKQFSVIDQLLDFGYEEAQKTIATKTTIFDLFFNKF